MKKAVSLLFVALMLSACSREALPFDDFAQCLTDKNIVMYGSDSCPHCQAQKQSFKGSFDKVTYVECNQNPTACQEAEVRAYPTWQINGENTEGRKSLSELAELSGCELAPSDADSAEDSDE